MDALLPTTSGRVVFDAYPFQTWPIVFAGAVGFASLFAAVALMEELLFGGAFRMTAQVWAFAATAFVGYVGVAAIIRHADRAEGR